MRPWFGRLVLALWAGALGGCVSLRVRPEAERVRAFGEPDATGLGRWVAAAGEGRGALSGFRLLEYGQEALVARTALADAAERSIDAQYYICDPDAAGSLFFERLLAAADRGVKVRLLLDDNNLRDDREMAVLCAHANIEVRVFNPFRFRARWARWPQYVLDFNRMPRRMHNKIFIVDNAVSVIGGRNIGNSYFSLGEAENFRDFDLLVAGPLTREASGAFDQYWNSRWAVPASVMVWRKRTGEDLAVLRKKIGERVRAINGLRRENEERRAGYLRELGAPGALVWARGEVVCEPPRKVLHFSHDTAQVTLRLEAELARVKSEVLLEMAYVVPTGDFLREVAALRERGVRVRLMTGALEAMDVSVVYSGYKRYRAGLLEAGVELHEYKARAGLTRSERRWYRPRSLVSSLHTKAMVLDRERVWIGSANLDPRSKRLNTEIAVLVESGELAAQLANYLEEDFAAERSWRVGLERERVFWPHRGVWREERVLTWSGERGGVAVMLHCEPATGVWQRTKALLYSLVPGLEAQL